MENQIVLSPMVALVGAVALISTLTSVIFAILAWVANRKLKQVDDIQAVLATDREKYVKQEKIEEIRAEYRQMHTTNTAVLAEISKKIDEVNQHLVAPLAVLQYRTDQNEKQIQALRDYKHDHVDSTVRQVAMWKEDKPWERA